MTSGRVLGAAVAIAVLAAVAAGLWMIGSPGDVRRLRLDDRRVNDLRSIATSVDVLWSRQQALPASLDDLPPAVGATALVDPVSGQRYEYRVIDAGTYELCATFEAEGHPVMYGYDEAFWRHGAGRQCFRLTPKEIKRS